MGETNKQKHITAITVRSSEILSTLAVVMRPEILANSSIKTFTAAAGSYICPWTTIKYTKKKTSYYKIYSQDRLWIHHDSNQDKVVTGMEKWKEE